ncbi:MAG: MFS transporter [candidate division Zixibacteria bacterium]|nr:MFS transporter [candidate division Zixibacteria bacterium]
MSSKTGFSYLDGIMALGVKRNTILTLTISNFIIWVGFHIWRIVFNNYAVEYFDASPTAIGAIQAVREIPGLLAFGVGALAVYMTESRIAALSIVIVGCGLMLSGFASSILILGMATFVLSLGFHYFEPTNTSQLLMLAGANQFGRVQGRYQSYESMAGLLGAGFVLSLTLVLDYRQTLYLIGGMVALVGVYLTLALPPNRGKADQRRMTLKREYWLYYTLSFLRGCRRHIFTTFAIFLLVKNYGLSITVVSMIYLFNNFATVFTHRFVGKISDRFGERAVLAGSSLLLIFIFSGYALVTYLPLLIAFFFLDNIMFGSSIALKSYLRRISTDEDLTGCLSFGMTANHITAVVIPAVGGLIWSQFGHQATFIAGATIVAFDLMFALQLPSKVE